jgi:hypothetical protein
MIEEVGRRLPRRSKNGMQLLRHLVPRRRERVIMPHEDRLPAGA